MPKEIVLSHGPSFFDEDGKEIPQTEQGLVQVGWQKDLEYVQVATLARDPVTFETKFEGYYTTLDRHAINELIRHLRKARDQAYGRDE